MGLLLIQCLEMRLNVDDCTILTNEGLILRVSVCARFLFCRGYDLGYLWFTSA